MTAFTKTVNSLSQNQVFLGWYSCAFNKSVTTLFLTLISLTTLAVTSTEEDLAFAGPKVLGIALADYEPQLPNSLDFIVVFSKEVSGVDKSDFILKATGDLEGAFIHSVAGGGAIYTVTILNVPAYGDGSLGIELKDSGTDIQGPGGTPSPGFSRGEYYYLGAAFDVRKRASIDPAIEYKLGYSPGYLQFSANGKKMFVLDDYTIHEYVLQTAYSMSDVDYTGSVESFTMTNVERPRSFAFHEDGKKMVMHNADGLFEYSFSTGFDVSTVLPDSRKRLYSPDVYVKNAEQVSFSRDGREMYASGYDQYVRPRTAHAILEIPFDPSSQSGGSLVNTSNSYSPQQALRSAVFNSDGTRLIAVDLGAVVMYSMDSPHDAQTLRNVAGIGETAFLTATSVAFNPAGTKMFVASLFGRGIYEFNLDTAPEAIDIGLSGTPPSNASSVDFNVTFSEAVTGVGKADFKLDISKEIEGASINGVSGSGAEYVVTVGNIPELSDGYVSIDLLKIAGSIKNKTGLSLSENYKNAPYHYVGAAFDVSRAVYSGVSESKTVESRENASRSIAFNHNGTQMFVVGKQHADIIKYKLSKAFDISTASYVSDAQRFSFGAQEINPRSLAFNHDGTRMYTLGPNGDDVSEYKLGTGYDLSTVSYQGDVESFLVRSEENDPTSIVFNHDGSKMFILGTGSDAVQAYELSKAYDVSTAVHTGSRPVGGRETNPYSIAFNLDGTKMYVMGTAGDDINEYTMEDPYDVVNSVYAGDNERFSVAGEDDKPRSLAFNGDGTKMFVLGSDNHRIHEYNLNSVRTNVVVSTEAAQLVNAPFTTTFTFSGPVTGFSKSDITVSNGSAGSFAAVSTMEYTAVITPATDGVVKVKLAADAVQDIAGNGNSESNEISLDYDGTKPVFTSGATVDFEENETGQVYEVTAADINEITFSLGTTGGDEGLFNLTNGVLTFKQVPDYETPKDEGGDNIYKVKFRAFDGINTRTKTVSINVINIDDTKPEFTSATQIDFVENGTGPAYIAEAVDESPLTYSLGTVIDSHLFSISGNAINFKSSPDFETPGDADQDNVYQFRVIASDGVNTKAHNVSVTVTDLNEVIPDLTDPVFTSPTAVNFVENGTGIAYTIEATDENEVSYSLGSANDEPAFDIVSGKLTFKTPPDFETPADKNQNNIYYIKVIASDGTNQVSQFVKITITDVDDTAPVFTSAKTVKYEENGTGPVYTAVATDQNDISYSLGTNFSEDLFEIEGGSVSFKSPPDFENPLDGNQNNIYYIEIFASDGINQAKRGVLITVTDVDDTAPVFTSATTTNFAENGAGVAYLAVSTDDNEVTYSLGTGHDEYLFNIFDIGGNQSIVLFYISPDYENPSDLDADNVYEIEVIASDGLNQTSKMVSVVVTDIDDTPAVLVLDLTYLENSNDPVYRATANSGNSIDYRLGSGRDEAFFNIEGEVISFKTSPDYETPLDADGDNIYEIELIADDGGTDLSVLINIRIIDEPEDTSPPDAPVITHMTEDTGMSDSDGITRDNTIILSGEAEAHATVELFDDNDRRFAVLPVDSEGRWSFDIRSFELAEATYRTVAEAIDKAGNRSVTSEPFIITIDFTAPARPVITGISDDTGASNSDGITSDRNITISGTAEANSIIEVSSQFGPLRSTKTDANGNWLLDITDINLFEIKVNLTAEAVDLAGNRSAKSNVFVLIPDFTAPVKPVLTGISDDTGASNSDGVTSDRNITISGTAEPNSTVEVSSQFGPLRSTQTDAGGNWLLDITDINLFEIKVNLTAEAVDLAGNRSAKSDVFVLTPDFTAPAKPVITGISDDTGASNSDGVTSDKNIIISGTAEANSSVEVSSQYGPLRSTRADANGDWLLDITDINLLEIKVKLTAEAVDLAGNRSVKSDIFVLAPDFTAPGVTIDIANVSAAGYTITALFDEAVSGLTLDEISITGGSAANLVQNDPMSYSFVVSLSGSTADVSIGAGAAQDIAGNDNTASNSLNLGATNSGAREGFNNLSNLSKSEQIRLYPNPASTVLTIDLSALSAGEVDVFLYNASGKPVFSTEAYKARTLKLDVSNYLSGMYIVQVHDGQQVIRKKVMVRK